MELCNPSLPLSIHHDRPASASATAPLNNCQYRRAGPTRTQGGYPRHHEQGAQSAGQGRTFPETPPKTSRAPTITGVRIPSGEVARRGRFELPTPRFVVWCSIQLSYRRRGRGHSRMGGGGQDRAAGFYAPSARARASAGMRMARTARLSAAKTSAKSHSAKLAGSTRISRLTTT